MITVPDTDVENYDQEMSLQPQQLVRDHLESVRLTYWEQGSGLRWNKDTTYRSTQAID
jgi:hypothetical protein